MLRLFFVCLVSLPFIIYYMWLVGYIEKHENNYTEAQRYKIAQKMVAIMKRNGFIHTKVFGKENLPKDGGYVMYANHQGKYDTLGIINVHDKPCTIVIDEKRSRLIFANQFISLLKGCRLDRTNIRSQVNGIYSIIKEVKAGRRFIIFPEGGYKDNKNKVKDFLPGSFKCAMKAKSPIVPVVLIDSYKVFGINSIRPVTTQVHFLKPLYYDEYKDMNSTDISNEVRNRIVETINSYA